MIAGSTSWVKAQLQRRKRVPLFPDRDVAVAAAEDVILGKLVYYQEGGSDKHLRDIAGILKFSGELLDQDYRRAADRELPELVFVKTVKGVRLLRLA